MGVAVALAFGEVVAFGLGVVNATLLPLLDPRLARTIPPMPSSTSTMIATAAGISHPRRLGGSPP